MAQRCRLCFHPKRVQADALLRGTHNVSQMSRDFAVTRQTIQRHRDGHLKPLEPDPPQEPTAAPQPDLARLDPQTAFLTSYAANGDVKAALQAGGSTRAQLRKWQEHDHEFALRYHQAAAEATEALEAEARIRAVAGSKSVRRIYRHGMLFEEIHDWRPSDAMLTKLLQAHLPEKYGDKLTVTQTTVVKALDKVAWDSV